MTIDSIRKKVAKLKRRFKNASAEEVCDELGIKILYIPMGKARQCLPEIKSKQPAK